MKITYKKENDSVTIQLAGELDHHNAKKTREAIDDILKMLNVRKLRLDFTGVTFMDSSGVGLLIGRYKLIKEKTGEISVICGNDMVKKIFEMSGVGKIISLK